MQDFLKNVVSGIGVLDILDILIVAFIIYKILKKKGYIKVGDLKI